MDSVVHEHLYCPGCSYDLFGLDRYRCPECGRHFAIEELDSAPRSFALTLSRFCSLLPKAWLALLRGAGISVVMFAALLNFLWMTETHQSDGVTNGDLGLELLPTMVFFALGMYLFAPDGGRKAAGAAYLASACLVFITAAFISQRHAALHIRYEMRHAAFWYGPVVLAIVLAKMGGAVWSATMRGTPLKGRILLLIELCVLTIAGNELVARWVHGDRIAYQSLLEAPILALLCVPLAVLLAWSWGMPLIEPMPFGVLPERWSASAPQGPGPSSLRNVAKRRHVKTARRRNTDKSTRRQIDTSA